MDAEGHATPYQLIKTRVYQRYVRGTMLFRVAGFNPFALQTYTLGNYGRDAPTSNSSNMKTDLSIRGNTIENGYLRVEAGGAGIIKSIIAKKSGRQWLRDQNSLRIELWNDSAGNCWTLGKLDRYEAALLGKQPEIIEIGPVRATVMTTHTWGDSLFRTYISLYEKSDWLEIRSEIDWQEREILARLCIKPQISGKISAAFRLIFHETGFAEYDVPGKAAVHLQPVLAWQTEAGPDEQKSFAPPLIIRGSGVILSAFKVTEDGQGFLIRLYESLGKKSLLEIEPAGRLLKSEIKIFESNLLEERGKELESKAGKTEVELAPFEIKSLILETEIRVVQI